MKNNRKPFLATIFNEDTLVNAFRLSAVTASVGVYAGYLISNSGAFGIVDLLAAGASLALFIATVFFGMPAFVAAIFGKKDELAPLYDDQPSAGERKRGFIAVVLFALSFHVISGVIGFLIFAAFNRSGAAGSDGFLGLLERAWMKIDTDAEHYVNIAENWYVTEGESRVLIVFFPMLPILMRALNCVIHNSFVSAEIINAAATSLACGMLYLTFLPVLGKKRALYAPFVALLLPGAVFFNSPMTEPLFLLFTVCSFYFIQNKKFLLAGLFAALAGFTRSLGVLLVVPIAFEGIRNVVALKKAGEKWKQQLLVLALALGISCIGTAGYLYINYAVTGKWTKFMEYQWSKWHQSLSPFYDTPRYTAGGLLAAIDRGDFASALSFWGPNLAMIFASQIIILKRQSKLPSWYTLYFLVYFAFSIGCSWLLSGVRYLSVAVPLIAAIALVMDEKRSRIRAFAILTVLYLAFMLMYMLWLGIY